MNSMITNVIYIEIIINEWIIMQENMESNRYRSKSFAKVVHYLLHIAFEKSNYMFLSYLISDILRNLVTKQLVTLMSVYNSYTCCH